MEKGNNHGSHRHSGKKRSSKSWLTRVEQFFFRYGLGVAGTILVFAGLFFILKNKMSSGYFSNVVHWVLNSISPKHGDPVSSEHLVQRFPFLFLWFIISVSGLSILKPSFKHKYSSRLWDSISYLLISLVIFLSVLMAKVTGIIPAFIIYISLSAVILSTIAILNERYSFLNSRRAFYYLVCITLAFILPTLMITHFFVVLAASLSVTILVHAYIFRSRTSLIISKILFVIMASLYLVDLSSIIHAYGDLISGGDKYPFHMPLSLVLVTAISYFYLKFKSLIVTRYPYLDRSNLLPSEIPETIFPFLVFSSTLLLFDYSMINIFPGYLPGIIAPAMFSYAFIWTYNYLKPAVSKPGRILRIIFSYLAIIIYPAVINPEINKYRDLLTEGQNNVIFPFLIHYACLILIMLLLVQSNRTLRQIYHGENKTRHFRYLMVVILSTFMMLTEYDHLSLLLLSNPAGIPASEMIILNKFFPYSIILILIALSLLVYSKIRYSMFLRRVSLSFIVLAVIKIFLLDLKILSESTSVIILISLGLALIVIALILQTIRKKRSRTRSRRKHVSPKQSSINE